MNKKGFTLIELMVAVSIMAILATLGLMMFTKVQSTARDARRKQDLNSLKSALELYYTRNSIYPPGAGTTTYHSNTGSEWTTGGFYSEMVASTPNYINVLPNDPLCKTPASSCDYYYVYYSDGYTYKITARLENSLDSVSLCTFSGGSFSPFCYEVTN